MPIINVGHEHKGKMSEGIRGRGERKRKGCLGWPYQVFKVHTYEDSIMKLTKCYLKGEEEEKGLKGI
jgi:hypothetical protein